MSEVFILPIVDPTFRVESIEDYQTLISFLANLAFELAEDYPEVTIWPTYLLEET